MEKALNNKVNKTMHGWFACWRKLVKSIGSLGPIFAFAAGRSTTCKLGEFEFCWLIVLIGILKSKFLKIRYYCKYT